MRKRRPIRRKLFLGGMLVLLMVALLSASSFLGTYSYRRLVRGLSSRAAELPLASDLGESVATLRLVHARALAGDAVARAVAVEVFLPTPFVNAGDDDEELEPDPGPCSGSFDEALARSKRALDAYRVELEEGDVGNVPFSDRSRERDTVGKIADCLQEIRAAVGSGAPLDSEQWQRIGTDLGRLSALSAMLPTFLQEHLHDLSSEVRTGYRMLIVTTWAAAMTAAGLLAGLAILTYRWVFRPLRLLGNGSRRVAAGDFAYRLNLDSRDEMAELAEALNDMTERFQEIRDDLDSQVQLRTREVVRSEQLASVGFLAAGVAHEINNPLAAIAMCAESLESRLAGLAMDDVEAQVARRYLELIQNEAFRCKGITEKLLDFSRLGEVRRQPTAIMALVSDVAEMLRHVGRFAGRSIDIESGPDLLVMVNPQEVKQVVLNLLVNALDCVEESGQVRVGVRRSAGTAVVTFTDDGCGMTEEVLEHLFEPFFTRRKMGQGTGLGLSIVHRIVADHGGRIEAKSDGPGRGATFRVTLPLADVVAEPPRRVA
ncbi:MAG: HAMP domain-containing protein [Planctomycetota bacterium]|nr:MAG: HAMP domain-containing protein [Planctomycetota bacterium]